jgi:predicted DNA-binding protein (MmcQ/YjbR family)
MAADPQHDRLLTIVKTLPGAYEDRPWGSVHCKVDGKIFVGWGRDDDGIMSIGIRVDKDQQAALVKSDPRFSIAKYVGKYGGVDMRIGAKPDWEEVEHFVVGSYRIIASKKRVKELDALTGSTSAPAPKVAKKKPAAKKPAKAPRR